jgi:hypothetical protein
MRRSRMHAMQHARGPCVPMCARLHVRRLHGLQRCICQRTGPNTRVQAPIPAPAAQHRQRARSSVRAASGIDGCARQQALRHTPWRCSSTSRWDHRQRASCDRRCRASRCVSSFPIVPDATPQTHLIWGTAAQDAIKIACTRAASTVYTLERSSNRDGEAATLKCNWPARFCSPTSSCKLCAIDPNFALRILVYRHRCHLELQV